MNAKATVAGFAAKTGILGFLVAKPTAAVIIALSTTVLLKFGGPFLRHLHRLLVPRKEAGSNNF
jgi:hypothetical protein